jgi:stage III sporulation protein AE
MSEAAETILICTSAVRNAAGAITVIGLGLVVINPFIKVLVIMLSFRLAAALGSPICDECTSNALEDAAGCISLMIGIMGASLFVLILLTGAMMSSVGLMK